jgi:glutaminyl-tRNA synthetase
MNTQKEINKFMKDKDLVNAKLIPENIINNIKSIDNYSLLCQTIIKNIKNDNNSLLFANLILDYSDKVHKNDLEKEVINKLVSMSGASQSSIVRYGVFKNIENSEELIEEYKAKLLEFRNVEKDNENLELLNKILS